MFVCAKAICLSGMSDMLCKRVHLTHDIHNYDPYNIYDIDASELNLERAFHLVKSRYLDTDGMKFIHSKEIHFVTSNTLIGGVFTNTANRNVSWYLLTSRSLPQNCSSDQTCISSIETVGGVVNFKKVYLQNRQQYYICARVQASEVSREFFTTSLDSLSRCSNGFVVDDDPPEPGNVNFIGKNNGFVTDPTTLTIAWKFFTDVEKYVNISFGSGIAGYAYALGKHTLSTAFLYYLMDGII